MGLLNDASNAESDIPESGVCCRPGGLSSHGSCIRWEGLEFFKRQPGEVNRPQDDGNHRSLPAVMPLHCPVHLDVVTVIRSKKVGTDEEEDYVRTFEFLIDVAPPLLPATNPPIVPTVDLARAFWRAQVILQLGSQLLVPVRIGGKNLYGESAEPVSDMNSGKRFQHRAGVRQGHAKAESWLSVPRRSFGG